MLEDDSAVLQRGEALRGYYQQLLDSSATSAPGFKAVMGFDRQSLAAAVRGLNPGPAGGALERAHEPLPLIDEQAGAWSGTPTRDTSMLLSPANRCPIFASRTRNAALPSAAAAGQLAGAPDCNENTRAGCREQ